MTTNQPSTQKGRPGSLDASTLRNFFDTAQELFMVAKEDGSILELNPAWERCLGYSRDEILARSLIDFVYPDDRENTKKTFCKLLRGAQIKGFENRFLTRSGQVVWLKWCATKDPTQNYIYATASDITTTKLMELSAQEHVQLLRQALDKAPFPALISNSKGEILFVNQAWQRIAGYEAKEFSTVEEWSQLVGLNDLQPFQAYSQVSGNGSQQEQVQNIYQIKSKSGETLEWEMATAPIIMLQSPTKANIFLTMAKDVTYSERSRRDMERLTRELQVSNQSLQRFSYIASHDLQQPLRTVISFLELLESQEGSRLSADGKELLAYAVGGAERMRQMIRGLLRLSQVDTKHKTLHEVSAQKCLDQALKALDSAIKETEASIKVDRQLPTVIADESLLTQLFQNLIENALKFRSKAPPEIVIKYTPQAQYYQFSVQDNGIGIDPERGKHIFEIFERLDYKRSGYGIGLALCKKIIEHCGGTIWFESAPGQGATFYFTLPKAT